MGLLVGAMLGVWVYERAIRRTANINRMGVPEPLNETGPVITRAPHNAELSAKRVISQESLEQGADQLFEAYQAQGITRTRAECIVEARQMLAVFDPMGGVQ